MTYLKKHLPGMLIGVLFTSLVAYFLIAGHTSTTEVPEVIPDKVVIEEDGKAPGLWACEDAPYCVDEDLKELADWWAERGYEARETGGGPCPDTCAFSVLDEAGEPLRGEDGAPLLREVKCKKGWTSITLRDSWFSADHAGETLMPKGEGDIVILLPQVIESGDVTETVDTPPLPADIQQRVCAHEIGHSFNKAHAATDVGAGLVMRKKGHIMHPQVMVEVDGEWFAGVGWDDEGL